MPAKHKYKCLNKNCSVSLFVAMTSPSPSCPKCGAVTTYDLGETAYDLGYFQRTNFANQSNSSAAREVVKQSDANLRRIADKYGLTDMDNKDGKAVKRAAPPSPAGAKVKLGGFEVDANAASMAGCQRLPVTAKLAGPQIKEVNTNSSPMLKKMTRVAYEHKAKP